MLRTYSSKLIRNAHRSSQHSATAGAAVINQLGFPLCYSLFVLFTVYTLPFFLIAVAVALLFLLELRKRPSEGRVDQRLVASFVVDVVLHGVNSSESTTLKDRKSVV